MGNLYFSQEDADMIRDEFTPLMAVELTGYPTDPHSHGPNVSILCPEHNDTHYGSCMISKGGTHCRCYVCNKSFSGIDLFMAITGKSFYEALTAAAEYLGISDRFAAKGSKKKKPDLKYRLLNREERSLLDFDNMVSVKMQTSCSEERPEKGKYDSEAVIPDDPDDDITYNYISYRLVHFDPLKDLATELPEEYARLVRRHAFRLWDCRRDARKTFSVYPNLEPLIRDYEEEGRKAMGLFLEFGGDRRALTRKGRDIYVDRLINGSGPT